MENIAFAYLFIGWLIGAVGMINRAEKVEQEKRLKFKFLLSVTLVTQLLATYILWQK
jgi:hypothetical protein